MTADNLRHRALRGSLGILYLFIIFYAVFNMPLLSHAKAPLPPLHEAELLVSDGPEVLAAIAAMDRDYQLQELSRQREGVKYFLNASFGYYDKSLDDDNSGSRSYTKLTMGAGFIFPLLGTWNKQRISSIEAEINATESKYRPQILKLHNLSALRKAYITLWAEGEKISMANRFLSTEAEVSKVFEERQRAGLLLPADRLEALTAYDIARRDVAVSELSKTRAMQIIRLATGQLWDTPKTTVATPTLPDFRNLKFNLENHPEIIMRNETLKKYEKLLYVKNHIDREAALTIGATSENEFSGTKETSAHAALTVTEPLKALTSRVDRAKSAAGEELERAKKDELFTRIRVEGESDEILAYAGYAAVNINAQKSRLIAMSEAVRERVMRHLNIAGDTFEKLHQSRCQYYRVAMDMLDSEMIFMQTGVELLGYAYPGGTLSEPSARFCPIENSPERIRILNPDWLTHTTALPGGTSQVKPLPVKVDLNRPNIIDAGIKSLIPFYNSSADFKSGYIITNAYKFKEKAVYTISNDAAVVDATKKENKEAQETQKKIYKLPESVYIWNAEPLLTPGTREKSITAIKEAGFSHVLLSLNAAQITGLDKLENSSALAGLLSHASMNGVRIDAMLGDSHWVYPAERPKLLDIVRKLSRFNFGGIHLAIEPDSLDGSSVRHSEFLDGLIETVKEVRASVSLPLSISIYPGYLEKALGVRSNNGFGALNLEYVAVMIYSTNRTVVMERFSAISILNSRLKLKLAQSVEASLSPEESYSAFNSDEYMLAMNEIDKRLSLSPRFKGIVIQSWEDFNVKSEIK